jgi:hypothetical protein
MVLKSMVVLALGGLLAGAALLPPAPAAAQGSPPGLTSSAASTGPGRVHASSYGPVPGGLATAVRPWDNSAANLRLKATFADTLSRRGVKLGEGNTPLALNFETEVESLSVPDGGPTLGQVIARNHESRVRMNFWSTTQDSLTQGRRGDNATLGTVRYMLRATLDDRRSGTRLWQGEASYTGVPADETATFAAMVPVLLEAYGQTVRQRSFQVE